MTDQPSVLSRPESRVRSGGMELVDFPPQLGQRTILRSHLRGVFDRSPFSGEAWTACIDAFLVWPGMPLLPVNCTNHEPASYFLNLNTEHEPTPVSESEAACRLQLDALGERVVWQLVSANSATRMSFAIYLDDELQEVLAFSGRPMPGPFFTDVQNTEDLAAGTVVRSLVSGLVDTRIAKVDVSRIEQRSVELTSASGMRYRVTFGDLRMIMHPDPVHETIAQVDELLGPSGRTWFVFRPVDLHPEKRQMSVQADSAEWIEVQPGSDESPLS